MNSNKTKRKIPEVKRVTWNPREMTIHSIGCFLAAASPHYTISDLDPDTLARAPVRSKDVIEALAILVRVIEQIVNVLSTSNSESTFLASIGGVEDASESCGNVEGGDDIVPAVVERH